LQERCKTDRYLAEACKKENKTLDGVVKHIIGEARSCTTAWAEWTMTRGRLTERALSASSEKTVSLKHHL
jgi:hypothetical protein